MNKKKDTFTRSDIETSLIKEFPNLTKPEIAEAIDIILDSETLKIPHPEIIHRDFVLIPLLEITGYNFRMPKFGKLIQYV